MGSKAGEVTTKRERHLIATLQGITLAEFQDKPLEYSDLDVKHLMGVLTGPELSRIMNDGPHSRTFTTNVDAALLRIRRAEESPKQKK
jgi:hypothetical protein